MKTKKVIICRNEDGTLQVLFKDKGVELEERCYDLDPDSYNEDEDELTDDGDGGRYVQYIYPADTKIDDTCVPDSSESDA